MEFARGSLYLLLHRAVAGFCYSSTRCDELAQSTNHQGIEYDGSPTVSVYLCFIVHRVQKVVSAS